MSMAGVELARGLTTDVEVNAAILSHEPCVCLHPILQVAAVSHKGHVAEYDLASGTKLGSSEVGKPPLAIQYTSDASTLIGITEENELVAWEPLLWRRKILTKLPLKAGKPLIGLSEGSRPAIYTAFRGGREVCVFLTGMSADAAQKERQNVYSVRKGILALAIHPYDPYTLFILHEDSSLSSYSLNLQQHSLTELWSHSFTVNATNLPGGILIAQQFTSDEIILLMGANNGDFTALSSSSGQPAIEILNWKGLGSKIIGAGHKHGQIFCFSRAGSGEITPHCWYITSSKGSRPSISPLQATFGASSDGSASGGQQQSSKQWESLWLPKANSGKQRSSGDEILLHSSGSGLIVSRNRQHVSLTPFHDTSQMNRGIGEKNQPSSTIFHTGVEYWHGEGETTSKSLIVESPIYYVDKGNIIGFNIIDSSTNKELPDVKYSPVHLVHSFKQNLLLVFFDATHNGGDLECPWIFTAFSTKEEMLKPQKIGWTLPGTSAVFVGMEEEHYAVLVKQHALIYASSAGFKEFKASRGSRKGPEPQALKKIALSGPPLALFPGPAWSQLPRAGEEDELARPGNGLIMWSCTTSLAISEASTSQMLYRSSSLKGIQPAHRLNLQPQEKVLQVAWQNLLTGAEGSVLDDTGEGKASVVGGVLTTRRVLVVSATLQILVSFSTASNQSSPSSLLWVGPALLFTTTSNQVKQLSWDGSVALVSTLGGSSLATLISALPDRLVLLRTNSAGSASVSERQASVLEPLLHGWASLAAMGVLPGGVWRARAEMGKLLRLYESSKLSSTLFQVLLTAGCGDVALALARKGGPLSASQEAAMRAAAGEWQDAVQATLQAHKNTLTYPRPPPKGSKLWQRLVLLGQTALAYGQTSAARECWRAAGHYQQLLPLCALQGDFSAIHGYIADAPPEAKLMGEQLLSSGQSRFAKAQAVGAQPTLGDWKVSPEIQTGSLAAGVAQIALELPTASSTPTVQIKNRYTDSVSALSPIETSRLESFVGIGSANSWSLATRKSKDSKSGPSPFVDSLMTAPSFGRQSQAEASLPTPSETPITPASDDPFEAFGDSKPKESISKEPQNSNPAPIQPSVSNSSNPPPLLGSLDSFNSTAAKISPRKSSLRQKSRAKDDFYSSDSDEAQSENASTSTPVKRQFKIVIRDKAENLAGPVDLKAAASNLKLPPFSAPMGLPKISKPSSSQSLAHSSSLQSLGSTSNLRQSNQAQNPLPSDWGFGLNPSGPETSGAAPSQQGFANFDPFPPISPPSNTPIPQAGRGALPEDLFSEAPPPTPPQPSANIPKPPSKSPAQEEPKPQENIIEPIVQTSTVEKAPQASSDPKQSYSAGIKAMESGDWDEAGFEFRSTIMGSTNAKQIENSAYYLAAILLLDAQGEDLVRDARLSRFAASLPLQDRHKRALVQKAAQINMDAKNFGYAADQLMWLVTTSLDSASPAVLSSLQQKLNECEQKGSNNANIPVDEDRQAFPSIVATAKTGVDVEDSLKGII